MVDDRFKTSLGRRESGQLAGMSRPPQRFLRRSFLASHRPSERWTTACTGVDLTSYQVKEYLARYPNVLREYLFESTPLDFLEEILERKKAETKNDHYFSLNRRPTSVRLSTHYSQVAIEDSARSILECATDEAIREKIYDICEVVALTIDAFTFNIYKLNDNDVTITLHQPKANNIYKEVGPVGKKLTVSAHVMVEKKTINVTDLPQDARFPKGELPTTNSDTYTTELTACNLENPVNLRIDIRFISLIWFNSLSLKLVNACSSAGTWELSLQ